jgi:hypothetical protein
MNIIEKHNEDILNNLIELYETNNISNIIFHGSNLTGKKTLLEQFLRKIYLTQENFNKYVLTINCSHGKGNIKFIRENLKYFANSIILNNENTSLFKSIILLNADKLTVDAQSALRRSIEIYNHSTRFFIVVEDKSKLLKPIISRFSDIYFHNKLNLVNNTFYQKKYYSLNKYLNDNNDIKNDVTEKQSLLNNIKLTNNLYNHGVTGNMLINYIDKHLEDDINKYQFLIIIEVYKKYFRNEKLIIMFCLNFLFNKKIDNLENINFL